MKNRIMVVDDDTSVRQSLKKLLVEANYEVWLAANGQDAIAQFELTPADLVVLDLNLPGKTGWDVFERITTRHPTVPIIIITGLPNQFTVAQAAGVGALMEKPIDAPVLLETMARLLGEPRENHLRRMHGQSNDTRYFPAPDRLPTRDARQTRHDSVDAGESPRHPAGNETNRIRNG